MRLAIFGRSCSGKTSLSRGAVDSLSYPVRHCGQAIRAWATDHDLADASDIPPEAHQAIDAETIEFALKTDVIIDGCFLNYVLFGIPDLLLIELICSFEERSVRLAKRYDLEDGEARMRARDLVDDELRAMLYGGRPSQLPSVRIDTSSRTVDQVLDEILGYVSG
jgi:cytidylate kinase